MGSDFASAIRVTGAFGASSANIGPAVTGRLRALFGEYRPGLRPGSDFAYRP